MVLLGYPLMMDMTPEVRENDLRIYQDVSFEDSLYTGRTFRLITEVWSDFIPIGHLL